MENYCLLRGEISRFGKFMLIEEYYKLFAIY